jgi:hypothetical protein
MYDKWGLVVAVRKLAETQYRVRAICFDFSCCVGVFPGEAVD